MPCLEGSNLSWYRRALAIVFLFFCVMGSAGANNSLFSWGQEPELLQAVDVFQLEEVRQQDDSFEVNGRVTDGYYVYRHSLKLVDGQGNPVELGLTAGTAQHDEFYGDTEIYT